MIHLPPLRDRPGDVPILVTYFLQLHCRKMGKQIPFVAPETLRLLEAYHWPGNVRELQDAVFHGLVETSTDVLTPESLPDNVRRGRPAEASPGDVAAMVHKLIQDGDKDILKKVE